MKLKMYELEKKLLYFFLDNPDEYYTSRQIGEKTNIQAARVVAHIKDLRDNGIVKAKHSLRNPSHGYYYKPIPKKVEERLKEIKEEIQCNAK